MTENLCRVILDILKDFDYRRVSQKELQHFMGDSKNQYLGAMSPDNEVEVDRLAYEWKQHIDGVYFGKKE